MLYSNMNRSWLKTLFALSGQMTNLARWRRFAPTPRAASMISGSTPSKNSA